MARTPQDEYWREYVAATKRGAGQQVANLFATEEAQYQAAKQKKKGGK